MFAQKLACGESVTRQRAFRTLQDWIRQQSSIRPFNEADMLRLCKGLHYVLWMQDKMLLQEELADRISQLLLVFTSEQERVLFIESVFKSLAKEWNHIDRWRMDKFLMMMRRVLRVLFTHLSSLGWKKSLRDPYFGAFRRTTISSDRSFPDGLKFHFASLILDEMDNAGGISKEQITACLQPFADLLGVRTISDYLFNSVSEEIFATILHQKSEEIASKKESDEGATEESSGIEFDYGAVKAMLFDVGKRPETISKRRKKLYDLVRKFEVAAKGGDPYHFVPPVPEIVLTPRDLEEAAARLKKLQEEVALERKRMKLEKRRSKSASGGLESKKPRRDGGGEECDENSKETSVHKDRNVSKKKKNIFKIGVKGTVKKKSSTKTVRRKQGKTK